jgi:hypothetical protein
MYIDGKVYPLKTVRGHNTGKFVGRYRDVSTLEFPSKESASEALSLLIATRCDYRSTAVNIVSVRGHVGVFSYGLDGSVDTRHVWPNGHVSLMSGDSDMREAEDSFRYHVAQHTWDGTLAEPGVIPADKQRQFRSWAEFQLRYRYATRTLGLSDTQAHSYACDTENTYQSAAA